MSDHHCPGLFKCRTHPRWHVVYVCDTWTVYRSDTTLVARFHTHTQAIHYAQARALADLPFASRTLPPEVVEAAREHLARKATK